MEQVKHQRLYLKEPRTDRLRKSAQAELRHLLATGWRETERWNAAEYITVRMERTGPGEEPSLHVPAASSRPRSSNHRNFQQGRRRR
jgi:hypothetical protein